MLSIYLILSQTAISAITLARNVGVRYDTAWSILKRLHIATEQTDQLTGIVALDEVYLGGRWRFIHYQRKVQILRKFGFISEKAHKFTPSQALQAIDKYKFPVFGGNDGKRIFLLQLPTGFDKEIIKDCYKNRTKDVTMYVTDDSTMYSDMQRHEVNNHSKHQYRSEGGYSSNPIEGTFAHYRTQFVFAHVHCKREYLQLYLNLFVFKWNHRDDSMRETLAAMIDCIASKKCTRQDIANFDGLAEYKRREQAKEDERRVFAAEIMRDNCMVREVIIKGKIYDRQMIKNLL